MALSVNIISSLSRVWYFLKLLVLTKIGNKLEEPKKKKGFRCYVVTAIFSHRTIPSLCKSLRLLLIQHDGVNYYMPKIKEN